MKNSNLTPADITDIDNLPSFTPEQLVGFCDAESCFYVGVSSRPKSHLGFQVRIQFIIRLGVDSVSALFAIQKYFGGVGTISWGNSAKTAVQFSINSTKDIRNKVIPLFELFPLISSKRQNYEDFLRVLVIMESKAHLTSKGLDVIRNIAKVINTGRSHQDKVSYIESIANSIVITPAWLSGFMDGDSNFRVFVQTSPRRRCDLRVAIGQNSHDIILLEKIRQYLGLTNKIVPNTNYKGTITNVLQVIVYPFKIHQTKIVPICKTFSFITSKSQDFETYATVIERIAQGQHLTTEGFNQIVEFVLQRRKTSNKNKIV
jgi:hypothetical protein